MMHQMTEQPVGGRPRSGDRIDYAWFRTMATRWGDNDIYGHVNNVVYYAFFDTAVNAMLIERGLLDPDTGPVIGLVVETGCSYAAPLSFPDDVTAGVRVARIGTSSVRYEIALFARDEDRAAATGYFVHVHVDRTTRRPVPVPADMRAFLETLVVRGVTS